MFTEDPPAVQPNCRVSHLYPKTSADEQRIAAAAKRDVQVERKSLVGGLGEYVLEPLPEAIASCDAEQLDVPGGGFPASNTIGKKVLLVLEIDLL